MAGVTPNLLRREDRSLQEALLNKGLHRAEKVGEAKGKRWRQMHPQEGPREARFMAADRQQ